MSFLLAELRASNSYYYILFQDLKLFEREKPRFGYERDSSDLERAP